MIRRYIILLFCLMATASLWAQEKVVRQDTIRCKVYFRQGYATIVPNYMNNRSTLETFIANTSRWMADPNVSIRKILITSGSSPDGVNKLNERLSQKRSDTIIRYLKEHTQLDMNLVEVSSTGVDWEELTKLVEQSELVPDKTQLLKILKDNSTVWTSTDQETRWKKQQILALSNRKTYQWLYDNLFPQLRHAGASIACVIEQTVYKPVKPPKEEATEPVVQEEPQNVVVEPVPVVTEASLTSPTHQESFRWALKTNGLYLAALVPNIGIEYVAKDNWSIAGNWMYAWWKNDVNRRWRVYGGDVAVRRWFGRQAESKSLTGHHVGIYAQALTYDFCLNEKGYMGGQPGGNLWDKLHYAFGVEYGYSLPIARRLNLDFALGIGYMGGTYHEYRVIDDCKVWQATKNRKWFGPTKAEVSLVWFLGKSYSKKEGGAQ